MFRYILLWENKRQGLGENWSTGLSRNTSARLRELTPSSVASSHNLADVFLTSLYFFKQSCQHMFRRQGCCVICRAVFALNHRFFAGRLHLGLPLNLSRIPGILSVRLTIPRRPPIRPPTIGSDCRQRAFKMEEERR